jgi:hypothetical protein
MTGGATWLTLRWTKRDRSTGDFLICIFGRIFISLFSGNWPFPDPFWFRDVRSFNKTSKGGTVVL